jgi:hypothetical protein
MSDHDDRGRREPPEYPRTEPEIIPPERQDGHPGSRSHVWVWVADRDGMRRTAVPVPGPFAIFLVLALVGLAAAVILIAVLSAVLLWIPVLILVVSALLLSAAARQYWWRFRNWLSGR